MSFKNSLLMAALLAVVAIFIFRYEIPESERAERESFVIHKVDNMQVQRIGFSGAKGNFAFVRSEGEPATWLLEGVPEAKLDNSLVTGVVSALQAFKSDSVIPADEQAKDLSVYGLSDVPLKLEVKTGVDTTSMEFGKRNEFIGKRYVKISTSPDQFHIILADDTLFRASDRARDEFREKNPIQFADSDLSGVNGEWSGTKFSFVPDGAGWQIKQPIEISADSEAVLGLVREVRGLKVAEYIDQKQENDPYKLSKPDAKIEFTFKDASKKPIIVSASAGEKPKDDKEKQAMYFTLGGASIYKAAENVLDKIIKPVKDFRQRRFFEFNVEAVKKLEMSRTDGKSSQWIAIVNNGTTWSVNDRSGDAVFILQLLNDISFLEAMDFPGPNEMNFGFEQPLRTFKITLKDGDGPETTRELLVGRKTTAPSGGKGYYIADGAKRDAPVIISEASASKLSPKYEALLQVAATPAPL